MAKKKSAGRIQEVRSENVFTRLYDAWQRRDAWQKTVKYAVRVYEIYAEKCPHEAFFVCAATRVEAAGFLALHTGTVTEPKWLKDDLASLKQQRDEIDQKIKSRLEDLHTNHD